MNAVLREQMAQSPKRGFKRSVSDVLASLDAIATNSPNLLANRDVRFQFGGEVLQLPHYTFIGPRGGDEPVRIGLFAGIHGDEPEGVFALAQLLRLLESKPALAAAEQFLPRNREAVIDGFNATNGVIRDSYTGVLSAPPEVCPRPFEIILETPKSPPQVLKEAAFVAALQSILTDYRELIAYAPNL